MNSCPWDIISDIVNVPWTMEMHLRGGAKGH
jgi:hypothetical protein